MYFTVTKTLCDPPHVHGHIPQIISFLLNALVARAPVVVWTVNNAIDCINIYPVDNAIIMWAQLHVGKADNTIHWILIFTQWISQLVLVILIHWIVIYLVDSATQHLNKQRLLDSDLSNRKCYQCVNNQGLLLQFILTFYITTEIKHVVFEYKRAWSARLKS